MVVNYVLKVRSIKDKEKKKKQKEEEKKTQNLWTNFLLAEIYHLLNDHQSNVLLFGCDCMELRNELKIKKNLNRFLNASKRLCIAVNYIKTS